MLAFENHQLFSISKCQNSNAIANKRNKKFLSHKIEALQD